MSYHAGPDRNRRASDENVPFQSVGEILWARRGGELFDYLLDRFAVHSGLSGVQPKVMIRGENKASPSGIRSATHIVKFWDQDEYPELAANEFFCLTIAQKLGMRVPPFQLSDDGGARIVERFDLKPDGGYLGFEDFCVLNGVTTGRKTVPRTGRTTGSRCNSARRGRT
jgi:serine/threonine-protein kinase HipA